MSDADNRPALNRTLLRIAGFPLIRDNGVALPPWRQGKRKSVLRIPVFDGIG
jgi:hypothetical protein